MLVAVMVRFAQLASGVALVSASTKVTLGQDVDYPPYAYIDEKGELQGFGKDIADGMTALCDDLEIEVVQTAWSDCWGSGTIGPKLADGSLDACTTYTHTKGIRNDFLEFSGGILDVSKAAGLLTLLEDGAPKVDGESDLDGVTVVDVAGWAPTADTIEFVMNKCTDRVYSDKYTMISAEKTGDIGPNDVAMMKLRDGEADAIFLYSDQAKNYQCMHDYDVAPTWNCTLWEGFGSEYAYVQTGQFGYVFNGTTLAISKKGSGVADKLNPCLWEYMQTKAYYDVCVKHDFVDKCYRNEYFPEEDAKIHEYNKDTNEHRSDCSDGYCACPSELNMCARRTLALTLISLMSLPILNLL